VRLVQIDSPELSSGECYAAAAQTTLARLLPADTRVRLELDPRLDHVDRYGRTLAYVWKGAENVNVTLVARGAASVWFYDGARGRYAAQLMSAARAAKAAKRGLRKACPGTRLDPLSGVSTGTARTSSGSCDLPIRTTASRRRPISTAPTFGTKSASGRRIRTTSTATTTAGAARATAEAAPRTGATRPARP
jgi:hypothetical protein